MLAFRTFPAWLCAKLCTEILQSETSLTSSPEPREYFSSTPGSKKQWKIQPNKNTAFCSCLASEVMGKEVIEAAKAVVIKKSQSAVVQDEENINGRLRKLEEKQDSLQVQLTDLSAKLDTILNVIQSK